MDIHLRATNPNLGQNSKETDEKCEDGLLSVANDKVITHQTEDELLYGIEDGPPWYATILFSLQLLCQTIGSFVSVPLLTYMVVCPNCPTEHQHIMAKMASSNFLVSGISTLLQNGLGTRLPVEQAACSKTLIAVIAYISSKQVQNFVADEASLNKTISNCTQNQSSIAEIMEKAAYENIQEIQGGVILFGTTEFLIGATGLVGVFMKLIGPITIAPTLTLIGISIMGVISRLCAVQWGIAALTGGIVIISSLFLGQILVPIHYLKCSRNKEKRHHPKILVSRGVKRFPIFQTLPVAFAVMISWILCAILTTTDVFPDDKNSLSYRARTDAKVSLIYSTPWFRFPYPGQWGYPRFTVAAYTTMLAAMFSSIIESIGDYYATARVCKLPPPPSHAINRGIAMEGLAGITAGIIGSGGSTTSYSNNVGLIGLTKVASRQVTMCLGVILIMCGFISKFGAALSAIPDPVIGGISFVSLALVSGVGISSLKHANMDLARNQCIVGLAILMGVLLPNWITSNKNTIKTGNPTLDQVLVAILSNPIFIGAFVACFLDNITPGSPEDRGIKAMHREKPSTRLPEMQGPIAPQNYDRCRSYDLPYISGYLDKKPWSSVIPIFPQYRGWNIKCCNSCQHVTPISSDS